jgi:D-erythrose 4-phosphate dehydrogenase
MPDRPYRVALNGYGRIGRCVLRAFYERGAAFDFQFVSLARSAWTAIACTSTDTA